MNDDRTSVHWWSRKRPARLMDMDRCRINLGRRAAGKPQPAFMRIIQGRFIRRTARVQSGIVGLRAAARPAEGSDIQRRNAKLQVPILLSDLRMLLSVPLCSGHHSLD